MAPPTEYGSELSMPEVDCFAFWSPAPFLDSIIAAFGGASNFDFISRCITSNAFADVPLPPAALFPALATSMDNVRASGYGGVDVSPFTFCISRSFVAASTSTSAMVVFVLIFVVVGITSTASSLLEVRYLFLTFIPSFLLLPCTPVGCAMPLNSARSSNTNLDTKGLPSLSSLNLPMHLVKHQLPLL
jgi:hypothetical protein